MFDVEEDEGHTIIAPDGADDCMTSAKRRVRTHLAAKTQ